MADPLQEGGRCCIALKMQTSQDDYEEGNTDIFAGPDGLTECYDFDLGDIVGAEDLSTSLSISLVIIEGFNGMTN